MIEQREGFYRCTFLSPRSRRTAHVRAWDVGEAVQLFRTELQTDGVVERGTIEVSDLDGSATQRARYRPLKSDQPVEGSGKGQGNHERGSAIKEGGAPDRL
jgi:hypothetical protein